MDLWPFDEYDTRARVFPFILMVAPIAVVAAAVSADAWSAAAGLASLAGVSAVGYAALFAVHQWVRDKGYDIERALWKSWGGPPTTRYLRHRDKTLSEAQKDDLHAYFERHKEGWRRPSEAMERREPALADQEYESAVRWLRTHAAKSPRANLVNKANALYGFRRNCLGIRFYGILACCAAALANGFLLAVYWPPQGRHWLLWVSAAFLMVLWAFWLQANSTYVHKAAHTYAIRLFECPDGL